MDPDQLVKLDLHCFQKWYKRDMCILGLIWPPLEPKTDIEKTLSTDTLYYSKFFIISFAFVQTYHLA